MDPKIIETEQIKLVGIEITTSLSEDKTKDLWKTFVQRVNEIPNRKNDNYYSVQIYAPGSSMETFTPITPFNKWAAVAVHEIETIPAGMDALVIAQGMYAVFKHKGIAADFFRTSQYIYGTWLPASEYALDDRPHFEIMGPDYGGPDDPNSEEDVYIPVKV